MLCSTEWHWNYWKETEPRDYWHCSIFWCLHIPMYSQDSECLADSSDCTLHALQRRASAKQHGVTQLFHPGCHCHPLSSMHPLLLQGRKPQTCRILTFLVLEMLGRESTEVLGIECRTSGYIKVCRCICVFKTFAGLASHKPYDEARWIYCFSMYLGPAFGGWYHEHSGGTDECETSSAFGIHEIDP